jgi:hypothetical protein
MGSLTFHGCLTMALFTHSALSVVRNRVRACDWAGDSKVVRAAIQSDWLDPMILYIEPVEDMEMMIGPRLATSCAALMANAMLPMETVLLVGVALVVRARMTTIDAALVLFLFLVGLPFCEASVWEVQFRRTATRFSLFAASPKVIHLTNQTKNEIEPRARGVSKRDERCTCSKKEIQRTYLFRLCRRIRAL